MESPDVWSGSDKWFKARHAIPRWKNALRVLKSMTPHTIETHFDMSTWGVHGPCGTTACLGGHCGLDPWFRKRGLVTQVKRQGWARVIFPKIFPGDFFADELHGERLLFSLGSTHPQMMKLVERHIARLKKRATLDKRKRR